MWDHVASLIPSSPRGQIEDKIAKKMAIIFLIMIIVTLLPLSATYDTMACHICHKRSSSMKLRQKVAEE
jgi:hypothetical protein